MEPWGNPQLFKLALTLNNFGGSELWSVAEVDEAQYLKTLLMRISRRLGNTELRLMEMLSVFRSGAPANIFDLDTLDQLLQRGLIQADDFGAIAVMPVFREAILAQMNKGQREVCNRNAAYVLAFNAQYTEAAFHLIEAGDYAEAFHLWYPHHQEEIDQGNSTAALNMFRSIPRDELPEGDFANLTLLISELQFLCGDLKSADQSLMPLINGSLDYMPALALEMRGRIKHRQGETDDALRSYEEALRLNTLNSDIRQASIRMNLSWGWRSKVNLQHAWREAQLGMCEIELVQGYVQCDLNQFETARSHYQRALTIAEAQGYELGRAKGHDYLALLAHAEGNTTEALSQWSTAMHYYIASNNPYRVACVKANKAQMYLNMNNLDVALLLAQESYEQLKLISAHQAAIGACGIVAQVFLAQRQLALAESKAQEVVDSGVQEFVRVGLFILGKIRLLQGEIKSAQCFIESCILKSEIAQDEGGLVEGLKVLIHIFEQTGQDQHTEIARGRLSRLLAEGEPL